MSRTKGLSLPVMLILLAASMLFGSCTSDPPEPTVEAEAPDISDEDRDRMPEDGAQAME